MYIRDGEDLEVSIVFTNLIILDNEETISLYLKMPQKSKFKILDTTYIYKWNRDLGPYLYTETIVENETYECAKIKLLQSNRILSFIFNFNVGLSESKFHYPNFMSKEECIGEEIASKNININKLKNINDFLKKMKKKKFDNFIVCTKYFSRGLEFHYGMYLNEEALLNIFKVIELISKQYYTERVKDSLRDITKKHFYEIIKEVFNEEYNNNLHSKAYAEIQESIERLVDKVSKRKIKVVRKKMMIKDTSNITDTKIDMMVEYRNKSIAHGNFKEQEEEVIDYLITAIHLSKKMIIKYFFEGFDQSNFGLNLRSK